jgi:D-alanyl-D-alanine carboxypeptidase
VNGANPLNEDDVPKSLVNLYEQKGRHFQLAAVAIELDSAVFSAMNEMFAAANADGLEGFTITSGYRSYAGQVEVFAAQTDGTAVKPGTSEHQTGLAFDVTTRSDGDFSKTPQFEWLLAHCSDYGFILRYPQNAQTITGVPYEPWHYRYVGLPHSKIIMERGITLEEYLYQQQ